MEVIALTVGLLQTNCYLLVEPRTKQALIVDPGGEAELILGELRRRELAPVAILCTHGHPDHVSAAQALCREAGVTDVYMHPGDIELLSQFALPELGEVRLPEFRRYDEGDVVRLGESAVRVLHTPGHSPGSVCLAVDGQSDLLTGDLIFAGGVGRFDLPGGSYPVLLSSLQRVVNEFPAETVLYPGHGPCSTLATELATNPWFEDLE